MGTDENRPPALPVYLVEWAVPRQQRDAQKAAAAVGTGSLVQLVGVTLAELHRRAMSAELGGFLPRVFLVVGAVTSACLEQVVLERTDASWDRMRHFGTVHYSLDHPSLKEKVHLSVSVPFCPGCLGRGGAHTAGCWAGDKPALPLA